MTQVETILDLFRDALNFTLTLGELYEEAKFPHSSIRRVISILKKRGILERIDRGVYKFLRVYVEVLHTKRVIDTHTKDPKHRYDIDIEFTSTGYVPSSLSITQIEKILNPKLIEAGLEKLGEEGIFLPFEDDLITFKIMGTEIRDGRKSDYTKTHEVSIYMTNNVGVPYTFKTKFYVNESEFYQ